MKLSFKKNMFFSLFNFASGQNFIGTSLALDTFFSRGHLLRKSKIRHRLHWGTIILHNSNVQMLPKKFLEHAQAPTTFFNRGRHKCSFRSIALGS